ncbi:MAG: glycosyltransferase [Spirochaetales bacterium]|nr:glycosyltransferase [Spirochaetales bacterium]
MRILYVGYPVDRTRVREWPGPSVAGNKLEHGVIQGFRDASGGRLDALSITPVAMYPASRHLVSPGRRFRIGSLKVEAVPFVNLPLVKQATIMVRLFFALLAFMGARRNGEAKAILTYNAASLVALPLLAASLFGRAARICLLSDPPLDLSGRRDWKTPLRALDNRIFAWAVRRYDGIIAANGHAAARYAPRVPCLVIGGGVDVPDVPADEDICETIADGKFHLMYAGALTEYNGVPALLEAAASLDYRFVLHVFGGGPLAGLVEKTAGKCPRIVSHGPRAHEEVLGWQRKVDLLVNPKDLADPISAYSFPSKLLEYLQSGTPVLSTLVRVHDPSLFDHLYLARDGSAAGLAEAVRRVADLPEEERLRKGRGAKAYVEKAYAWGRIGAAAYSFIAGIAETRQRGAETG